MDSRRSKRRYVSKCRARFQNMGHLSFVRCSNSEAQETEQRADVEPCMQVTVAYMQVTVAINAAKLQFCVLKQYSRSRLCTQKT